MPAKAANAPADQPPLVDLSEAEQWDIIDKSGVLSKIKEPPAEEALWPVALALSLLMMYYEIIQLVPCDVGLSGSCAVWLRE